MTEPARHNYQPIQPATTDGLEDLFSVAATSSESVAGPAQDEDVDVGPSQYVSALQAAELLGINKRSVLRLIQEQKLDAVKKDGRYFIALQAVEQRKQSVPVAGPSRDEVPTDCVLVDIEDAGPSQSPVRPSQDEGPPQTANIDTPETVLNAHKLLKELEGATYRIGYLEAQLEAERNQVKLLTDALHKPVWWRRAWSWFISSK